MIQTGLGGGGGGHHGGHGGHHGHGGRVIYGGNPYWGAGWALPDYYAIAPYDEEDGGEDAQPNGPSDAEILARLKEKLKAEIAKGQRPETGMGWHGGHGWHGGRGWRGRGWGRGWGWGWGWPWWYPDYVPASEVLTMDEDDQSKAPGDDELSSDADRQADELLALLKAKIKADLRKEASAKAASKDKGMGWVNPEAAMMQSMKASRDADFWAGTGPGEATGTAFYAGGGNVGVIGAELPPGNVDALDGAGMSDWASGLLTPASLAIILGSAALGWWAANRWLVPAAS